MAVSVDRVAPVAHLPLVLGVLRKLEIATLIDSMIPPHPDQVVSAGRAVEALVLSILDGHHALYKVGRRLDERGMLPLLQPGLAPQSLHDSRLGQTLDALYDASLHTVFSAMALRLSISTRLVRPGCIRIPPRFHSMALTRMVRWTTRGPARPMVIVKMVAVTSNRFS